MKKLIVFLLFALAGLSLLLPVLYSLGTLWNLNAYFYQGSFILCSSECFLRNGQLMYYEGFLGTTYIHLGVFLIAGLLSALLGIIHLIHKAVKRLIRR